MLIRIHVAIAKNSIPYYNYLRQNYIKLCSSDSKLEFYVYSMEGNLNVESDKFILCKKQGRGSTGHAYAIEEIVKERITEDIKIIADSDTVMLMKDWDKYIKKVFGLYQNYKVIAPPQRRIGSKDAGDGPVQSYKFKPTLIWCAYTSDVDFSNLEVMPNKQEPLPIDTEEKSMLWNLPVGKKLLRDVAWQIPQFLEEQKISYALMDNYQPSDSQSIATKGAYDYSEEYQLWGNPLVAHQRGSNYHAFRMTGESKTFYDSIERYINEIQR
jgi:hypothetical protein